MRSTHHVLLVVQVHAFSGTAEANSTVKVSVSDAGNAHNLVGSTTADGSGIWTIGSLDLSGLADGPITVSATTTDAVGNTGPAGAQSGSKDTVAPAAPPVDVFSAVNAAGAASVSFSGTAEPNSTVNVAVCEALPHVPDVVTMTVCMPGASGVVSTVMLGLSPLNGAPSKVQA